jgi:hypothetical protein
MTDRLDVPVALFVFNRPDLFARVLSAVRSARPRLLLVVADGARPGHSEDISNCRAVLDLVESVDWPCEIRRCVAEQNLGCDVRITSGLDWVFGQVAEAIVLEDDIVPDPSFFPWCAAMLYRYRDQSEFMHVSGRNVLGRWGDGESDHLIARRGSVWGWATWARAWFGVGRTLRADESVQCAIDRLALDPLLRAELDISLGLAASGGLAAWDVIWKTEKVLAGGLSIVSTVNLVMNAGFGAQATRTDDEADLRAVFPSGSIARSASFIRKCRQDIDPTYDRWSLLLELMAAYRNPALARKLARFPKVTSDPRMGSDSAIAHHLAPFATPEESIAVLEHLNSIGIFTPRIAALHAEFRAELNTRRESRHV